MVSHITGNSATLTLNDEDAPSFGRYLKLVKSGKVIAVGALNTGEVDLTGLEQRKHVNYKDYLLLSDDEVKDKIKRWHFLRMP